MEQPEVREWMDAPSNWRSDPHWQQEGWEIVWRPYVEWAQVHSPSIYERIEAAENRVIEAALIEGRSPLAVIHARRACVQMYLRMEAAYITALTTRRF